MGPLTQPVAQIVNERDMAAQEKAWMKAEQEKKRDYEQLERLHAEVANLNRLSRHNERVFAVLIASGHLTNDVINQARDIAKVND